MKWLLTNTCEVKNSPSLKLPSPKDHVASWMNMSWGWLGLSSFICEMAWQWFHLQISLIVGFVPHLGSCLPVRTKVVWRLLIDNNGSAEVHFTILLWVKDMTLAHLWFCHLLYPQWISLMPWQIKGSLIFTFREYLWVRFSVRPGLCISTCLLISQLLSHNLGVVHFHFCTI